MGFKLADLFVEITGNPKPFHHALEGVHHALHHSGEKLREIFSEIATGALLGLGFKAAGALEMISHGFEESFQTVKLFDAQLSKTAFTFGEASRPVIEGAEEMAEKFGIAKTSFLSSATDIGMIVQNAGMLREEAAKYSTSIVKLAADVQARKPEMSLEDVLDATRRALMGQSRGLKGMGIMMDESVVKTEAVRMGMIRMGDELDDNKAVIARASVLTKLYSTYQGELARSSESLGIKQRELAGRMEEAWESLGQTLRPIFAWLLDRGVAVATALKTAWDGLGIAVRNLGDFWEISKLKAEEVLTNLGAATSKLLDWMGKNWINVFSDVFAAVGTMFSNVLENLKNGWSALLEFFRTGVFDFKWTPLLDGFKAVTEKLPDLFNAKVVDMQPKIDAILEGITEREKRRREELPGGPAGKFGPIAPETAKAKGNLSVSLEEFAKTLQEGALGKSDTAKTAENTAKLSVLAEQQVNLLRDVRDKYPNPGVAAGPA